MNFNEHYDLRGQHAFLSASKYHWVNYDEDKISSAYSKYLATEKGTKLHELASQLIDMKIKLPKTKNSFNMYVNDAIGFRMKTEQPLVYSINAFGTADSICFREKILRIHDLKTGVSPVSMVQLEIYSAYFCLEYKQKPEQIEMELRLYQNGEILIHQPDPKYIREIMNKIVLFDQRIEKIKSDQED